MPSLRDGPPIPNSAIMDIFPINFHGNYVLQPRFSLGIDLGTSNSAVALSEVDNDQTNII